MTTQVSAAETSARVGRRGAESGRGTRLDIQALRALAVGLVVLYHFWPARLTGGYVGVDVFFVISGFLITTHLVERPPLGVRGLAEFWARRIRRLLPAALLVLLATMLGTWLFAPATTWGNTATQATAAAFYVENWALAREAVDYLAADNAATPVQHYWSLSIEEQFYLLWPVLVLVSCLLARRLGWSAPRIVGAIVSVVVVVSLGFSVRLSAGDAAAYFLSWTRFWELGIGALAAIGFPATARLLRDRDGLRQCLSWAGLLAVVYAAWTFDGTTVFPGTAALVPVLGTAAVILADAGDGPISPLRLARLRPVRSLGDISYSVYLWHWPVVVLLPLALGRPDTWPAKVAALAAVLVVAAATKRYVEDPLRGRRPLGDPLRRSFVFAIVGMLIVAGVGAALRADAGGGEHVLPTNAPCFGAKAAVDPACTVYGDELLTDPVFALGDKPAVYRDDCISEGAFERHVTCTYGTKRNPTLRVALIGNSHAGQYLPPLRKIATREKWEIQTYLAYECHTVDRVVVFPEADRTAGCKSWNDWAIGQVEHGDFDLVVTTNRTQRPIQGLDGEANVRAMEASYRRVLSRWTDSGAKVFVVHDDPRRMADESTGPDCVAQHTDDLSACDKPLARSKVWDPGFDAAVDEKRAGNDSIATFDPTPYVCPDGVCHSVVGGVIVWWDTNHFTKTFATTLAPALSSSLKQLVPRP